MFLSVVQYTKTVNFVGLDLALKTPTAEDSVGSPATITDTPTPSAADKRENFCFNVDQAQKVFETSSPDLSLGKEKWVTKRTPNFGFRKEKPSQLSQSCPDFGFCKGNRKEDGKQCRNVVNK